MAPATTTINLIDGFPLSAQKRTLRVALVMSDLAVSARFPTFSTAASISCVVSLRRLLQRRAKAFVDMVIRSRGSFGRDGVTMAVLHYTENKPSN